MTSNAPLTDRVALITGAAGGLGSAIALAFVDAGASVAINDVRSSPALQGLADRISERGGVCVMVPGNVADPADVAAVAGGTLGHFGRIDVLVNNAGIMTEIPFLELSVEEWDRMIAVDLRSVFLCTQAVLPSMLERKYGVIINVSSQLGQKGAPTLAHYCAAKGGVLAFTRAIAQEVGKSGVRVNAIAPGPIETDMTRPFATEEWIANKAAANVLGRLGTPDEIAPTAVFLASDAASFYVGQTLYPNGGGVML